VPLYFTAKAVLSISGTSDTLSHDNGGNRTGILSGKTAARFVPITSQAHSNTSSAAAISPPAALCTPLNVLLFLVTGFKDILNFQINSLPASLNITSLKVFNI
jgi:hypothetical protein